LNIPAGVNPLTTLRLQGKGNEILADNKKIVGDAYVIIDYPTKEHGVKVENGNIYASINVPFDSVLSEENIRVNILGCKEIEFKLNSSYKSGHPYKIEKQGITDKNFAMVKVFIDIPKNKINDENRNKLVKLAREIYGRADTRFEPFSSD
jgi:DnaJ-class molecular chaperone